MKKVLLAAKNNYQIVITVLTLAAILSCYGYGKYQKAQAQRVDSAIEKTR